jgi:alpha-beta hydrolase superfamily lysophospholipase
MPVPTFPSLDEATHAEGFLNSADHLRLYWQRYRPAAAPPRRTVLVLHGGGDHSGRYPGITRALVRAGFEVALIDFRGHGQSDGRRWHVDAFADYLRDLEALLGRLAEDVETGQPFVVAHSQGALVALRWALEHPDGAAGLVLTSPYLGLALRPPLAKVLAARLAGRLVPWLPVATGIDYAALTSDAELQAWTAHDPLYGKVTTPRWFEESGRAQAEVLARAAELRLPLLVMAAGDDRIADLAATRRLVAAATSTDKRLTVYEGFRHEVFNEVARERPIAEAVAWLLERCK